MELISKCYQLQFPCKPGVKPCPTIFSLLTVPIIIVQRRLLKNRKLHENYLGVIETFVENGYAKFVPLNQLCKKKNRVWYFRHHSEHQPLREEMSIVFDCAAKQAGESLNNSSIIIPTLLTLCRWRTHQIPSRNQGIIVADIELTKEIVNSPNCNALRFLKSLESRRLMADQHKYDNFQILLEQLYISAKHS